MPNRCRSAMAARATGEWAIQVGAFAREGEAHLALGNAREHAHVELAVAHPSWPACTHRTACCGARG